MFRLVSVALALGSMLAGGQSARDYAALQQFLSLSDADVERLRQRPANAADFLSNRQRRKIDEIANVVRSAWIYEAVAIGLIGKERWPGGILCNDEKSSEDLGLDRAQRDEIVRLHDRPRAARLAVLTKSQLARLALYEAQLDLFREALDLGLVKRSAVGEPLCH